MKRIRLSALITAAILCVLCLLAGCGGQTKSADPSLLLGTWVKEESDMTTTFTFNADGTFDETVETDSNIHISMSDSGTWSYDGAAISITYDSFGTTSEYSIDFGAGTMKWDNGQSVQEFKKKLS